MSIRKGQSEEVVGRVLSDLALNEIQMLVATEGRVLTGPGQNQVGFGRSHVIRTVETSLKRLHRDHIDLLQLHDRDTLTPLHATLRALDRPRHARQGASRWRLQFQRIRA